MTVGPWWAQRAAELLEPKRLTGLELGALWRLHERLLFVRENTEPALLKMDVQRAPALGALWSAFQLREIDVRGALTRENARVSLRIRSGALNKADFRAGWETLGYLKHERDAGTPADDYLDGLFDSPREHAPLPDLGSPNMATRAAKVADFLSVMNPGVNDVVFDLGSGSGKMALTVSASCDAQVVGVEICAPYVDASRGSARSLSLTNCRFDCVDVREADLSEASIFYLYFPFRGALAQSVAERIGALATKKAIRIYATGPVGEFGVHFEREVTKGTLSLSGKRGEFGETMLLESA
ncbi:MAG: class I SAM-dependent methyltransferase [Archangium sp.]